MKSLEPIVEAAEVKERARLVLGRDALELARDGGRGRSARASPHRDGRGQRQKAPTTKRAFKSAMAGVELAAAALHEWSMALSSSTGKPAARLPKDLVLLQLALILLSGGELTYARLADEFLLERRTAERYLADLKRAGLPVDSRRVGRQAVFALAHGRSKDLRIEAVDVPPAAARSLSLLLVAAALLPDNLGVREAVDATVRAALRLRGLKAAGELRRLEDAVMVLENDAKDYGGLTELFGTLLDATLSGQALTVRYRSPRVPERTERFFAATVGLYRGGLYVLAVDTGDDGRRPTWRAVERIVEVLEVDEAGPTLAGEARMRALDEAERRWGPARTRPEGELEQVVTLHFSEAVAPYVLARPWHSRAEMERWPDEEGGGVRMAIRLSGDTVMFESWVRSWGAQVQVLRPADMAARIADSLEAAARAHRAGPERWRTETAD